MLFTRQIKISENFGSDYIEKIIENLRKHFSISDKGINEADFELIFFNYLIDGSKVSFLSEGMNGTFIVGKSRIVNKIIKTVNENNPELFEIK